MTKLTHEYELEISKLREKTKLAAEFERRPQVSPVEFAKLERALVALKNENASLQDKLSQSNETIEALRSDLKGTHSASIFIFFKQIKTIRVTYLYVFCIRSL